MPLTAQQLAAMGAQAGKGLGALVAVRGLRQRKLDEAVDSTNEYAATIHGLDTDGSPAVEALKGAFIDARPNLFNETEAVPLTGEVTPRNLISPDQYNAFMRRVSEARVSEATTKAEILREQALASEEQSLAEATEKAGFVSGLIEEETGEFEDILAGETEQARGVKQASRNAKLAIAELEVRAEFDQAPNASAARGNLLDKALTRSQSQEGIASSAVSELVSTSAMPAPGVFAAYKSDVDLGDPAVKVDYAPQRFESPLAYVLSASSDAAKTALTNDAVESSIRTSALTTAAESVFSLKAGETDIKQAIDRNLKLYRDNLAGEWEKAQDSIFDYIVKLDKKAQRGDLFSNGRINRPKVAEIVDDNTKNKMDFRASMDLIDGLDVQAGEFSDLISRWDGAGEAEARTVFGAVARSVKDQNYFAEKRRELLLVKRVAGNPDAEAALSDDEKKTYQSYAAFLSAGEDTATPGGISDAEVKRLGALLASAHTTDTMLSVNERFRVLERARKIWEERNKGTMGRISQLIGGVEYQIPQPTTLGPDTSAQVPGAASLDDELKALKERLGI